MNSDYKKTYEQLIEQFLNTPIENPDFFHKRTLFGYLPISEFNELLKEATDTVEKTDTDQRVRPISLYVPSPPVHITTAYHLWRYTQPRAYKMKKGELVEEPIRLWRVSTGQLGDIIYAANRTLIDRAVNFARKHWPLEQAPTTANQPKRLTVRTLEELATIPEKTTRDYPPLIPQSISPADKVNERLSSKSQRGMATRITRRIEKPQQRPQL